MRVEDGEHALARFRAYPGTGTVRQVSRRHGRRRGPVLGRSRIPYVSLYAYDELLAPVEDLHRQANTVLHAMERLTWHLTDGEIGRVNVRLSVQEDRRRLSRGVRARPQGGLRSGLPSSGSVCHRTGTIEHIALRDIGPLGPGTASFQRGSSSTGGSGGWCRSGFPHRCAATGVCVPARRRGARRRAVRRGLPRHPLSA